MFPDNVNIVHIELTDKCQASCPMCPRNVFGGVEGSNVLSLEITLNQFKTWFPPNFLQQLDQLIVCGNLGDPLMNKECLEIFEYVKLSSPDTSIHVYTNGSLRTKEWWLKLATVLKSNDIVVFAIDGFEDTHSIYRRGTVYQKIIDNAKTFIDAGGNTRADILVFEHNEHQVEELSLFLTNMGFNQINCRTTDRFHGLDSFPVQNKKGEHEYYLRPPTGKYKIQTNPVYPKILENLDDILSKTVIKPKCLSGKGIYVNCKGLVYPCSWVGSTIANNTNIWQRTELEETIKELFFNSATELVNSVNEIQLDTKDIVSSIKESNWNSNLPLCWGTDPQLICAKNCGTNFIELIKEL